MASTIVTKNSSTASAVPVTGDLTQGELAVNVTDKRLFTKNSGGTVVELGTNPASLALPNGTANGVAYLNGSKVVTTGSALTFDGTSLSVGTSSHPSTLAVYAATGGSTTGLTVNASGNMLNLFSSSSTNAGVIFDATDGTVGSATGVPMIYRLGGTEQMRLTSTGLGIGTSSPAAPLTVQGSAGGLGINIIGRSAGQNEAWLYWYKNGGSTLNAGILGDNQGLKFAVDSSATERMRLDTSGNLGLGVTPSAWGGGFIGFQIKNSMSLWSGTGSAAYYSNNVYYDGTSRKYISSATAAEYEQGGGVHSWKTAASGTAGNAITFTQAMTLDASGNLLVGTTSTSYSSANRTVFALGSGANGSLIDFQVSGATSDGYIYFDGTNATIENSNAGYLRFSTNAAERARIDSSGNFLVGTTNPNENAGSGFKLLTSGQVACVTTANTTNAQLTTYELYSTGAGAFRFYVGAGGTIYATSTTITAISDQRLKENIQDLDVGLDAVMALKPRKFDWKEGKGKNKKGDRGWIAQEFEQVFPDMIDEWRDPAPEGEEPYKAVNADLIPVLVKAIQELKAEFDAYKATHP